MKKGRGALILIVAMALVMIFLISLMHTSMILQHIAVIDAVIGKVEVFVHGHGSPITPEVGKLVRAGDVIQTGANGVAELRWVHWGGGMRIKIGPNTRFLVTKAIIHRANDAEESRLKIDFGKVWIRLRKPLTKRSKFEVETPTVVATIRGTIFAVSVGKDGTSQIEVLEGEVAANPKQGNSLTISKGKAAIISQAAGEIINPRPLNEEELKSWNQQTSMLGPFLEINSPGEVAKAEAALYKLCGRTERGTSLSINDESAEVSDGGEFAHMVFLKTGKNAIKAIARDEQGRETSLEYVVTVAAE